MTLRSTPRCDEDADPVDREIIRVNPIRLRSSGTW
jgi:hypothetical protein